MDMKKIRIVLKWKKYFENTKNRFFSVKDRRMIMRILKPGGIYNSLTELMGGANKLHALIWIKATGAMCQWQAHPGYY